MAEYKGARPSQQTPPPLGPASSEPESTGSILAASVDVPLPPLAESLAPVSRPVMYEVLTDTWGARAPIYRKGDTFTPDMLADRDLDWFAQQQVIVRLADEDPRTFGEPTGPTGDQSGIPTDGWHSAVMPESMSPELAQQLAALMRKNGATPAQVAAAAAYVGAGASADASRPTVLPPVTVATPTLVAAPLEGQSHVQIGTST